MGRSVSPIVLSSALHLVEGGVGYYAVKMADGSTVFASNDDELEPIVAFTSNPDPDLSVGSPLRALLENDIRTRVAIRKVLSAPQVLAYAVPVSQAAVARRKWSGLSGALARSVASSLGSTLLASADVRGFALTVSAAPKREIDDIRVAPLLTTKWSQDDDKVGNHLYNYYTPNNWPCGCTATANGQIMNYFRFPTDSMPQRTYTCSVDDVETPLTTIGGVYDWNLIAGDGSDVNVTNTEDQRKEIGKLLYDVGVALESEYYEDGTAAYMGRPAQLFRSESFGYANAFLFMSDDDPLPGEGGGGLHDEALRQRTVYANLDARRPVQFGINDRYYMSGHAVVGDGYGYMDVGGTATPYVHINLGWAGSDDAWYNLPEISTSESGARADQGGVDFEFLLSCAFNISPDDDGDILSGRTYGFDGNGVSNVTVRVFSGATPVGETLTDEKGVYAFTLPGDAHYRLTFEADGCTSRFELEDVFLPKTVADDDETFEVKTAAGVGNSWGNDMLVAPSSVRNVRTSEEFVTLDAAVAASEDGDRLEVFAPTRLLGGLTITNAVELCTVFPEEPTNALIACESGVKISVASGASVWFHDIAFASAADALIEVEAGGNASFSGALGVGTVTTADADGFAVTGPFSLLDGFGFKVSSAVALRRGETFGHWSAAPADAEAIAAAAPRILNARDFDLGGAAAEGGDLVWNVVPVDPQIAIAYVVENGERTYYRDLDQLFKNSPLAEEIFLLRDCPSSAFTNSLVLTHALKIASDGGTFSISPASSVSVDIDNGGALVLDNAGFADYRGEGLFRVNAGGVFTLTNGAALVNLTSEYREKGYGPVAILGGTFNMYSGTAIRDCASMGRGDGGSYGGGLFVSRSPVDKTVGTANLLGGEISGCKALTSGGGVYVASTSQYCAKVNLGGDIVIRDNFSKPSTASTGSPDDVWVANGNRSFTVVSALTGEVGVKFGGTVTGPNLGDTFATASSAAVASDSASAFFKDRAAEGDENFGAVASGIALKWEYVEPSLECDPADAVCRVIRADGSEHYYEEVSFAFEDLTGNSTVELLDDCILREDAEIAYSVVLRTADDAVTSPATLGRVDSSRINVGAGASLKISDLIVSGNDVGGLIESQRAVGRLISVAGGTLVLESGAVVCKVTGGRSRADSGVVVNGGTFKMMPGSRICNCVNTYFNGDADYGIGAGVLVDNGSTAYFLGGEITGCTAYKGAGVAVCNKSVSHVSGSFSCFGNVNSTGARANFLVEDLSEMYLDGNLVSDPCIGRIEGVAASQETFGKVPNWNSWNRANLTNSAAQFRHDKPWDIGVVATASGSSEALLVWRSAVIDDGKYVDADGKVWTPLAIPDLPDDPDVPQYIVSTNTPTAIAFSMIVVSNAEQTCTVTLTNLVKDANYSLYTATSIDDGFDVETLEPLTNFNAEADGPFTLTIESATPALFWKATGRTTYITNYLGNAEGN